MNCFLAQPTRARCHFAARRKGPITAVPTRNLDWKAEAACRDLETAIFFPDSESDSGPALEVCASCPVRQQCLNFALQTRQHDGIWGGATETERKRIRRRMGRVAAA